MFPATSEIYELNKMLFIYLMTVLIAFFWITKMIVHKKIILKKTPLDAMIVFFVSALVLSTVFSLDVHTSIFGYYGRFNGGLLSIFCYVVLYYAFVSNDVDPKKSIKSLLLSGFFVFLWGLPGHFKKDISCPFFSSILSMMSGTLDVQSLKTIWSTQFNNSCWSRETNVFDPALRMFSTLGQPNWMGAFFSVIFFLGLYSFFSKTGLGTRKVFSFFVSLFAYAGVLFSRSRSALGAVFIGFFFLAVYYALIKKIKKNVGFFALVTIVLLTFAIFLKTGISKVDSLFVLKKMGSSFSNKKIEVPVPNSVTESFDIRKIVWQGALKLGLSNPLFGTGVETFAYSYNFVRPKTHNLTSEWDYIYNKAHNEFLNYFATTGFVGLASYIGFILSYTWFIFIFLQNRQSKNKDYAVFLFTGWITINITNFFGFSTTVTNLLFFLIPAMTIVSFSDREINESVGFSRLMPAQKTAILILSLVALYLIFAGYSFFKADIFYGQGLYYAKPEISDHQKAAYYFQEALKNHYEHVYEDKLAYSIAYMAGMASYEKDRQKVDDLIMLSRYYSQKTLKASSKNVIYLKNAAKNNYFFYLATQDKKYLYDGVSVLSDAAMISATDPKIPYSLAVFYSMIYDLEENPQKEKIVHMVIDQLSIAIDLKSNYYDAYLFKGQFLKKIKETEKAKQVFEYILENINPGDATSLKEISEL